MFNVRLPGEERGCVHPWSASCRMTTCSATCEQAMSGLDGELRDLLRRLEGKLQDIAQRVEGVSSSAGRWQTFPLPSPSPPQCMP